VVVRIVVTVEEERELAKEKRVSSGAQEIMTSYYVIASREDWTHKETGSDDPVRFLWRTFSKGL
jgi:hypothetical protein